MNAGIPSQPPPPYSSVAGSTGNRPNTAPVPEAGSTLPPSVPTIYDETFRAQHYDSPSIMSMGNVAHMIGYLEHHAPTTDGSFSICVAGGEGVFVSKVLLDSIPEEYRPSLNTYDAGRNVELLGSAPMTSLGSVMLPITLTRVEDGTRVRLVLYAFVVPNLLMGMFIGGRSKFVKGTAYSPSGLDMIIDLGNGSTCTVGRK